MAALKACASGIVLSHNHPPGNHEPSAEDLQGQEDQSRRRAIGNYHRVTIILYLAATFVAICEFCTSGVLDLLVDGIAYVLGLTVMSTDFVQALTVALLAVPEV